MSRVLALITGLLIAAPALAADPEFCALWAREFVRIEVDHIGSAGLTREKLRQTLDLYTGRCLKLDEEPALPDRLESSDGAWLNWILAAQAAADEPDPGTVPATDNNEGARNSGPAVAAPPSDDSESDAKKAAFNAWCQKHFRSFRASDGTVVRRGSRTRIACPYHSAR